MTRQKVLGWTVGDNVRRLIRERFVAIYVVGVLGVLLMVAGTLWDLAWHELRIVETFFTPPHAVLYTGIGLSVAAAVTGALARRIAFSDQTRLRPVFIGFHIALLGGLLQVAGGFADFWWHETFGFDPFLFTPSHALLISGGILGGVGMAVGTVRLLGAHRAGLDLGKSLASARALHLLAVLGLAGLWLALSFGVYLVTDVRGIAYTFRLGPGFVETWAIPAGGLAVTLLALVGTLVVFASKQILGWRGAVVSVSVLHAGIVALANIGFQAWVLRGTSTGGAFSSFLWLYVGFLAPLSAFDVAVRGPLPRGRALLAGALVAPFAGVQEGLYAASLWTSAPSWALLAFFPMVLVGLLGGLVIKRFVTALTCTRFPRGLGSTEARGVAEEFVSRANEEGQ